MKFIVFCIGLLICSCNFSFGQQQGNLKVLSNQSPSDSLKNSERPTVEGSKTGGLNVSGWQFERPPRPKDNSFESGKIVFEIDVSKEGKVVSCKAIESSVSNGLMRLYRDAVLKSKLKPTNPEIKRDSITTGTVTFIITTR